MVQMDILLQNPYVMIIALFCQISWYTFSDANQYQKLELNKYEISLTCRLQITHNGISFLVWMTASLGYPRYQNTLDGAPLVSIGWSYNCTNLVSFSKPMTVYLLYLHEGIRYGKLVSKGVSRTETVLKTIMTPLDPLEGFVENYIFLTGDKHVGNYTRLLDLKV